MSPAPTATTVRLNEEDLAIAERLKSLIGSDEVSAVLRYALSHTLQALEKPITCEERWSRPHWRVPIGDQAHFVRAMKTMPTAPQSFLVVDVAGKRVGQFSLHPVQKVTTDSQSITRLVMVRMREYFLDVAPKRSAAFTVHREGDAVVVTPIDAWARQATSGLKDAIEAHTLREIANQTLTLREVAERLGGVFGKILNLGSDIGCRRRETLDDKPASIAAVRFEGEK